MFDILIDFSSHDTPKVVILTTFDAASGENFVRVTTFPFQYTKILVGEGYKITS